MKDFAKKIVKLELLKLRERSSQPWDLCKNNHVSSHTFKWN